MNLSLTSKEMEIILSLTSNASIQGDAYDSLWRKVSANFIDEFNQVREAERIKGL
jgi:hypothetical protein